MAMFDYKKGGELGLVLASGFPKYKYIIWKRRKDIFLPQSMKQGAEGERWPCKNTWQVSQYPSLLQKGLL